MREGKMLRITNELTVFIVANKDGSLIDGKNRIRYRTLGKGLNQSTINQSSVRVVNESIIEVLDNKQKPMFGFPLLWLDTDAMKIQGLVEKGLLKIN
jgi:hypothetical protein